MSLYITHGFKYRPIPIRIGDIISDFDVQDTISTYNFEIYIADMADISDIDDIYTEIHWPKLIPILRF